MPDPYPGYRTLHALGGAFRSRLPGKPVVLTHHTQCVTALRDRGFAPDPAMFRPRLPGYWRDGFRPTILRSVLLMHGTAHRAYRPVISQALTPRRVEAMQGTITQVADRLLDDLPAYADQPVDLIAALAMPYAARVAGLLLGLDADMATRAAGLMRPFVTAIEFTTADQRRAIETADDVACTLFSGILDKMASARGHTSGLPHGDDLAIDTASHFGPHRREDAIANLALLFAAGFDSTASAIGLSIATLLNNPAQARLVRDDPQLVPTAVEELLRFEPPVQILHRVATNYSAHPQITPGTVTMIVTAAANRDPQQHPTPDRLDLTRPPVRALTFGAGLHFCPGAGLARLELAVLLPRLLRRFPALRLASAPTFRAPGIGFRGIEHLPVWLSPPCVRSATVGTTQAQPS
ncbi:cytochrome P450 [Streptomyces gamaensis]|uniref:Cytochrome P450 n=1 Tax=Streptomyces gamaensis TaxID=1763542 RepID=A0ABW0ZCV1_9ACTN